MGPQPQPRQTREAMAAQGQPCQRPAHRGALWPRRLRAASARCARRGGPQPAPSQQPPPAWSGTSAGRPPARGAPTRQPAHPEERGRPS
eukprot:3216715-Alexandrium_andersonii.AAC.1